MEQSADGAKRILEALEATSSAGVARARFEYDTGWRGGSGDMTGSMPRWARLAGKALKPIARRLTKGIDMSVHSERGLVDIEGGRGVLTTLSGQTRLLRDGRESSGSPGDTPDESDFGPSDIANPLWLLAVLRGTTEAKSEDGVAYDVVADLQRASTLTPGGLATGRTDRFEDLLELRLEVALDDAGRIRRVLMLSEVSETGNHGFVVELSEFGQSGIDWSRIPPFDQLDPSPAPENDP